MLAKTAQKGYNPTTYSRILLNKGQCSEVETIKSRRHPRDSMIGKCGIHPMSLTGKCKCVSRPDGKLELVVSMLYRHVAL